jgi:hypothetical protein
MTGPVKSIRHAKWAGVLALILLVGANVRAQECAPCGEYEMVGEQRRKLEAAFRLSLTVPDCLGISNLNTCREIEKSLEEVTEAVDSVVKAKASEGGSRCLSCDPRPNLLPLAHGLNGLTYFLLDNGYGDPSSSHEKRLALLETWSAYRCPCSEEAVVETPEVVADREAHARDELARKCGPNFTNRRKGLRQVLRVPDDHPGCYQSRTCRGAMSYKGFDVEPGFWTYDGEYWYIWAERMTTAGEWTECLPETAQEEEPDGR